MKQWALDFWKKHGTRHVFFIEAWIVLVPLYHFLPDLQKQIQGLMIGLAMLWIKQVRSDVKAGNEQTQEGDSTK